MLGNVAETIFTSVAQFESMPKRAIQVAKSEGFPAACKATYIGNNQCDKVYRVLDSNGQLLVYVSIMYR